MTKHEELLELLENHRDNCGDSKGRDGGYLDNAVRKAISIVLELVQADKAKEVVDKVLSERKNS
jgi:hypothetical protein